MTQWNSTSAMCLKGICHFLGISFYRQKKVADYEYHSLFTATFFVYKMKIPKKRQIPLRSSAIGFQQQGGNLPYTLVIPTFLPQFFSCLKAIVTWGKFTMVKGTLL